MDNNDNNKRAILDQIQRIQLLLKRRHFLFGFPQDIESEYGLEVKQRILQRVPAVGLTSVVFLLIFSLLDYVMLPLDMAKQIIQLRVFYLIPTIIVICVWLRWRMPKAYLWLYSLAYLTVSLSVVWIIWRTHSQAILLPYEGLMIVMMYGFVVMALPFGLAALLNALTLLCYVFSEPYYILDFPTYVNNVLFLCAMYLAGLVCAWLVNGASRNQFLQRRWLNLNEELSRLDLVEKDHYLAVASHDLRQPMQALQLIAADLNADYSDPRVQAIKDCVGNLNGMFNQMLDVSRLQLGLMTFEPQRIYLPEFFQKVLKPYELKGQRQHCQLHLEPLSIWIYADWAALQRILSNLIQNALDHSDAQNIFVRVERVIERVRVTVEDDGKGIELQDQSRVFTEFSKTHSSHSVNGLGVGLSIVKQLSSLLNYPMTFHSRPGCTQFSFSLPSYRTEDSETLSVDKDQAPMALLISEDAAVIDAFKQWLTLWGWQVHCTSRWEAALKQLSTQPELVISEWWIQGVSAETLLNAIEDQAQYEPYILVVAEHLPDLSFWGCQGLTKPVSASRLRAHVNQVELAAL